MSDVTGRSFGSTTVAIKTEEGDWQVTVNIIEKRKLSDGDWEEKKLEAMCTHKAFDAAYKVASESALRQLGDALKGTNSDSLFGEVAKLEERS